MFQKSVFFETKMPPKQSLSYKTHRYTVYNPIRKHIHIDKAFFVPSIYEGPQLNQNFKLFFLPHIEHELLLHEY